MSAMSSIFAVLCITHITSAMVVNNGCYDVDTTACQNMARVIDVCSHACFASLCQRSCEECSKICYSCNGVATADGCNTTRVCDSKEDECILTETLSDDFKLYYRMGCASKVVCSQLFGTKIVGREVVKRATMGGLCCNANLCNNHSPPPGSLGKRALAPMNRKMSQEKSRSNTRRGTCQDIDAVACQRMLSYRRDLCNMQCFSEACPTTCGSCVQCYTCDHIQHLGLCRNITTCLNGEQCYVLSSMTLTGSHSYRVGCMHQEMCSQLRNVFPSPFGKRGDSFELHIGGACCLGSLCNANIPSSPMTTSTTSTTTTMRPFTIGTHTPHPTYPVQTITTTTKDPLGCDYRNNHGCPVTHTEFNNKCFLISDTPMDFISGKLFCAHHCSLVSEDFSSVIRQVIKFSREQLHDQSTNVYIGVQDKNHDGHFSWLSSGSPAFPAQTPQQGKYCATLDLQSMRPTAVACTETHYVLCEAFYRS